MRTLLLAALLLGTASCTAEWWPPPPPPPPLTAQPPASRPGRLTLSNFNYDRARVEAMITPYPDCEVRQGMVTTNFELPLNGTRVIDTPAGSDVCWRRTEPPLEEATSPGVFRATPWNRAYLSSGRTVDSRL